MSEPARQLKVKILVERRFGDLSRFENYPDHTDAPLFLRFGENWDSRKHDRESLRLAEKYRKELLALPAKELEDLFGLGPITDNRGIFEESQQRFFATPDYNHWAKAAYWSPKEALSLSLGIEPGDFDRYRIHRLSGPDQTLAMEKRFDLMKRLKTVGKLPDRQTPIEFVSWCLSIDLEIPDELLKLVKNPKKEKSPAPHDLCRASRSDQKRLNPPF